MKRTAGFTLAELLTVVGIIAILSAVGIPAYNDYVTRSKIAEATSALSDGRIKLEQYFQDNRKYTGATAPASTTYFDLTLGNLATSTYTITATGKGSMLGFSYTINQDNTKTTPLSPSDWTPAVACGWVVKKRSC